MTVELISLVSFLESHFPLSWAEDWDKVGLVVGNPDWEIKKIRLAVDPTVAEARAAAKTSGTLLLTHHPLLLKGTSFVSTDSGKGAVVTELISSRGALWCGHTNSDRSKAGTVGAWISELNLQDTKPLVAPKTGSEATTLARTELFGLGAIGALPQEYSVAELAKQIAQFVPVTAQGVLATGNPNRNVKTVAVCPGAGDSLLELVAETAADVYITSDLRHHPALEHLELKADPLKVPALIDVPHYASEFLYLPKLAETLRNEFPQLKVEVSELSSDPFTIRTGA